MKSLLILRILAAVASLYALIKQALRARNQVKREEWEAKSDEITKGIEGANSDEERARLAKELSDHISRMP